MQHPITFTARVFTSKLYGYIIGTGRVTKFLLHTIKGEMGKRQESISLLFILKYFAFERNVCGVFCGLIFLGVGIRDMNTHTDSIY